MTVVAWNQFTFALNIDDDESPKVLAMGNDCANKTWNIELTDHNDKWYIYKLLYYEKTIPESSIYLDSLCTSEVDFPYIYIEKNKGKCCRWILYNTI